MSDVLDLDADESVEEVAAEAEDELFLVFMPVIQTFSDYPLCTDQVPDDRCRNCTDDCPCKPRPPPQPTLLPRPKDPNRCNRCKEKILAPTKWTWPKAVPFRFTVFGDMHYHRKCFRCKFCQRSIFINVMIKEGENVFKQGDDIACTKCDGNLIRDWCNACQKPIRFKRSACENKEYHQDCLLCTFCGVSIAGHKRSSHHQNKPYCGNCLTRLFATRCHGCHVLIPNGIQSFYFRRKKYHFGCFKCALCHDALIVPGGPDKVVMVKGDIRLCADCFPKKCHNCGEKIPRGSGHYEMDDAGIIKCLECAHIGYNRRLKGKAKPEVSADAPGTGIGDITYGDSESEESQAEDDLDSAAGDQGKGRRRRKPQRKKFSTWGPVTKVEPEPKRLSNDLRVTEELYTFYVVHGDGELVPAVGPAAD